MLSYTSVSWYDMCVYKIIQVCLNTVACTSNHCYQVDCVCGAVKWETKEVVSMTSLKTLQLVPVHRNQTHIHNKQSVITCQELPTFSPSSSFLSISSCF